VNNEACHCEERSEEAISKRRDRFASARDDNSILNVLPFNRIGITK